MARLPKSSILLDTTDEYDILKLPELQYHSKKRTPKISGTFPHKYGNFKLSRKRLKRVQSIHTVSKNKTGNFGKFFARQKLQQYYKDNARPYAELYKKTRRRYNGVFSRTIVLLSQYSQPEDKKMSSRYQLTKKANTTGQGTLNVWHEAVNQKLNHVLPFFSRNKKGETATGCVSLQHRLER